MKVLDHGHMFPCIPVLPGRRCATRYRYTRPLGAFRGEVASRRRPHAPETPRLLRLREELALGRVRVQRGGVVLIGDAGCTVLRSKGIHTSLQLKLKRKIQYSNVPHTYTDFWLRGGGMF